MESVVGETPSLSSYSLALAASHLVRSIGCAGSSKGGLVLDALACTALAAPGRSRAREAVVISASVAAAEERRASQRPNHNMFA